LEPKKMPAYVIANVDVTDPARYEDYKRMVPPTIAAFGGRFLARGGDVHVLEGAWTPRRLVIVEFPSLAQARAWWESAEYGPAKALRQATATSDLVIVEGFGV
jgi:uncharacterized protein (DUF1330 family)